MNTCLWIGKVPLVHICFSIAQPLSTTGGCCTWVTRARHSPRSEVDHVHTAFRSSAMYHAHHLAPSINYDNINNDKSVLRIFHRTWYRKRWPHHVQCGVTGPYVCNITRGSSYSTASNFFQFLLRYLHLTEYCSCKVLGGTKTMHMPRRLLTSGIPFLYHTESLYDGWLVFWRRKSS